MDKIVFPAPTPSYKNDSNGISDYIILLDDMPCVVVPFEGSNCYMIYSHGNACDLGDMFDDLLIYAERFQCNVLGYEYKGYGSRKGSATKQNVKKDITHVWAFLTTVLMVPSSHVIIFGRSIGTGPSLYLAGNLSVQNVRFGGLIIQSPYTNIREVAKGFVGGVIGSLAGKYFDNKKHIQTLDCPVLIIHGEMDEVIPFQMGEILYDLCSSESKVFARSELADHNTWDEEQDILLPIEQWKNQYLDFDEEANIIPITEKQYTLRQERVTSSRRATKKSNSNE